MEQPLKFGHSIAANSMDGNVHTQRRNITSTEESRTSHVRPRPGRRRAFFSPTALQTVLSLTFLLSAVYAPSITAAVPAAVEAPPLPPVPGNPAFLSDWTSIGDASDEIIFDHSEAPGSELYPESELLKRQIDIGSSSSSAKPEATTSAAQKATTAISSSAAASTTDTSSATTTGSGNESSSATSTSSPLPKPFDGGLGTNFTQPSCPNFLTSMINNDTFSSCLPFSVLLQVGLPIDVELKRSH